MRRLLSMSGAALLATAALGWSWASAEASVAGPAGLYCEAIAHAVDASSPGSDPTFVASYASDGADPAVPGALKTAAFTYDNALAAISLVACGDTVRAGRIGQALVAAVGEDRRFKDGRVRNAYRAGGLESGKANLSGWWDKTANRWDEDAYQDGTSTGNAAWAALALLNLHKATGQAPYLASALRVLGWIRQHTADAPGPAGYAGGLSGFDEEQQPLRWKSTEHNIDVAAAARWAATLTKDPDLTAMAQTATAFVQSRFRPDGGYFLLGTKPDGSDADPGQLALDVQVWPVLGIADAPASWRRALGFADKRLRRGDGMTFAGFGPNRWTEGTAQAALAFRAVGADAIADGLVEGLPAHAAPSGLLFATSAGEVPTGLAVETAGGGAFTYFHWPHLGATAWAALATLGWNPFTGTKVS